MKTLQQTLNSLFRTKVPRLPDADRRDRNAFRRKVASLGTTFTKTRDGYIEVAPFDGYPHGVTICHHGWDETWPRFKAALEDPSVLDANGCYDA